MVRASTVIAALVAVAPLAASETITAHLSPRDVEAIRTAVRAATREPLLQVAPVLSHKPIRGCIPVKRFVGRPDMHGDVRFKWVTLYERTDQVSVLTGTPRAVSGGSYTLQKTGARWKIVSRDLWLQ
jgi:hypothetical protein